MSTAEQKYALFRHQIELRRFDDSTLAILESSILTSTDVKSRLDTQSGLKEFLRSESLVAIRGVADKHLIHKLHVLDFFVRAFAVVNDIESCLALRYEALIMRDSEASYSGGSQNVMTSVEDWKAFAQDSYDNGFYSVTAKACERALLLHPEICTDPVQKNSKSPKDDAEVAIQKKKIQNLSYAAMRSSSSTHAVQVQAAEYLKRKTSATDSGRSFKPDKVTKYYYSASNSFRDGIKKRNACNLKHFQNNLQREVE